MSSLTILPWIRACPDCLWFYDKSRQDGGVWYRMYAEENGRAYATIAKVRRYRQRHKTGE